MYKNILITGGSTKISFHLKKLINKKYKIFSPTKNEWNLSNPNFSKDKINLIKKCDKIILIDKGRIVAQGTHDELINSNSLYKNMNELQI